MNLPAVRQVVNYEWALWACLIGRQVVIVMGRAPA